MVYELLLVCASIQHKGSIYWHISVLFGTFVPYKLHLQCVSLLRCQDKQKKYSLNFLSRRNSSTVLQGLCFFMFCLHVSCLEVKSTEAACSFICTTSDTTYFNIAFSY